MGMMARMRSLAPWFIITVGGVFVLFMIVSDSNLSDIIGRSNNTVVGTIDGVDITYQQYAGYVDNYAKRLEQQQGFKIDDNTMPYVRDQVWESLVTEKLMEKKIKQFNIVVSNEEITEMILGPNPPEFLKSQFIDSTTGNFDRAAYETAMFDERNKENLIQIEAMLKQQRMQEKLQSYVTAAVKVTDLEVKTDYIRANTFMNMDYIRVNSYMIPDSDINVTDAEIKTYYDKNKDKYKDEPTRKIKYVYFDKTASQQDTTQIYNNLLAVKNKLVNEPDNFATYKDIYSDTQSEKDTVDLSTISDEAKNLLIKANNGDLVGPVMTTEGFTLFKLHSKIKTNKVQVRASHILIKGTEEASKKEADDIYNQLKAGANFAKLAQEKSQDGSAAKGGDLGWFKEKVMVDEFWNACLAAKIGVPTTPVKTQFGYHIINVQDKNYDNFVVEKIVNKIDVSASTVDRLIEKSRDFAYLADKDGFDKVAKDFNFNVIESMPFREESKVIPGLGYNESIVKFAFNNSVGSVSEVFNVSRGFCVVLVAEKKDAGFKPFDEVKESIKSQLTFDKKNQKAFDIAKEAMAKVSSLNNFEEAKSISQYIQVGVANDFNGNGSISGIGREFAVTERALKTELNKVDGPIKGTQGAYIIKVTSRTPFDETNFTVQKNEIKNRLLNQKKNNVFNSWLVEAKKEINVTDNRYKFYR